MKRNIVRAAIAAAVLLASLALTSCNAPDDAVVQEQGLCQEAAMEAADNVTNRAQVAAQAEASGVYLELVEVIGVDHWEDADTVVCKNGNGDLFSFSGIGYEVGDALTLTLHNNGTPGDRLDDSIEDVNVAHDVVTI